MSVLVFRWCHVLDHMVYMGSSASLELKVTQHIIRWTIHGPQWKPVTRSRGSGTITLRSARNYAAQPVIWTHSDRYCLWFVAFDIEQRLCKHDRNMVAQILKQLYAGIIKSDVCIHFVLLDLMTFSVCVTWSGFHPATSSLGIIADVGSTWRVDFHSFSASGDSFI